MSHCNSIASEVNTTGAVPQIQAWKSMLTDGWRSVRTLFKRPLQNRIDRHKFRKLHELDDIMLDDIGVTRDELHRVSNLPLSVDAALELQRMSLARRKKEHSGEWPR